MKTYKRIFKEICSIENLNLAFQKARKNKSKKLYVIEFEKDKEGNIKSLQEELIYKIYKPIRLKKFVIRDPKTRIIHASLFRDRIVHHAIVNILEPIFEKRFIYDSFASRKNKGTHEAVQRFTSFMRKVSSSGKLIKNPYTKNSIKGYALKADIRHYFDSMDHEVLLNLIGKKVKDNDCLNLIRKILENFEGPKKGIGLPLGNYTSQFFANVYLNELDYFVKHVLKAKYYIRYVDDFVILHKRKAFLEYCLKRINSYLLCLKLELHPDKSEIHALRNGINFLGYRIFYNYKLLRKRNIRYFMNKFRLDLQLYKQGNLKKEELENKLRGWFGYAQWANTYTLRKKILLEIPSLTI